MSGTLAAADKFITADIQKQFSTYFGKGLLHAEYVEIKPFLSVLQSIKAECSTEIWHLIVQLLHDYLHCKDGFKLPKSKVERYLHLLLMKHPDYAECLIANLPLRTTPPALNKREINITSAQHPAAVSPNSKRRKTETKFYNYTTPGVSAYLAMQGKPTRVVASPVTIASSPVGIQSKSMFNTSSPQNTNTQHVFPTQIISCKQKPTATSVLGNPHKINSNSANKLLTPSTQQQSITSLEQKELRNSRVMHCKNVVYVKKQDNTKPKQLTKLEEDKLKLAIQRIQCQNEQFRNRTATNSRVKIHNMKTDAVNHSKYHIIQYVTKNAEPCPEPIDLSLRKTLKHSNPLKKLQALVENSGTAVVTEIKKEPLSPNTVPPNQIMFKVQNVDKKQDETNK